MKLIDILFCDDIRSELNNKISLMGLYNEKIILYINNPKEAPKTFPVQLATLLRFELDSKENYPTRYEFCYLLNEERTLQVNSETIVNNKVGKYLNIVIPKALIQLKEGYFGFSISLFKGDKILFQQENLQALEVSLAKTKS